MYSKPPTGSRREIKPTSTHAQDVRECAGTHRPRRRMSVLGVRLSSASSFPFVSKRPISGGGGAGAAG